MRLATVVSQAAGTSMSSCCSRDIAYHRAYVSWTASSASASEPSSRYARLTSWRRSLMTALRVWSCGSSCLLMVSPSIAAALTGSTAQRQGM
jgi:hypothetical protein